jgi:hypothetical protein
MVHTPHGGDNICTSLTADSSGESEYLLTGDTGAAGPKTSDPPQVLISPVIVSQMRERKRQLQALQQWAQQQEAAR